MIPITKKECLKDIKETITVKALTICLISILGLFGAPGKPYAEKFDTKSYILMAMACAFMLLLFLVFSIAKMRKNQKNKFYIVQDKMVRIKKTGSKVFKLGPVYDSSTLYFQCNGSYHILGTTKKDALSKADYIALFSSQENDNFYLVLYNDKIIKCFNDRYYVIDESEFKLFGGKYLPKNT